MTNLIEQLGGYDACSNAYKELISKDKDIITCGSTIITKDQMRDMLLEHRRQHNIYEIGDSAIHSMFKHVFIIDNVFNDYVFATLKSGYRTKLKIEIIRHCTDKEIAQGYRDE